MSDSSTVIIEPAYSNRFTCIVKFSAVVWSGEECHELSLAEKFIAIFNYLK
jgi:hypothetical protein